MQQKRPVDDVMALWQQHRHWVAAVLQAHRPRQASSPDLEDLLQEVAMVLVRKQELLSSIDAIEPWLRTVAVNIARDAGRRVSANSKLDPMRMAVDRHEHDPSGDDATQHTNHCAATALEIAYTLPMTYSEPLLLSLRGLTYRQISRVLDLPESTIQNRLYRARMMVRSELEQRENHPPLRLDRSATHG
jgi:RNA polymerase sigma-70 factor (ECF subfamily)